MARIGTGVAGPADRDFATVPGDRRSGDPARSQSRCPGPACSSTSSRISRAGGSRDRRARARPAGPPTAGESSRRTSWWPAMPSGWRTSAPGNARRDHQRSRPRHSKVNHMKTQARRKIAPALVLAVAAALGVAACTSGGAAGGTGSSASAGQPGQGGTADFAEAPLTTPTYIFPLVSGALFTVENTADLQTLLYQPLYWYGDKGNTSVDYPLSIGDAPVYGDNDRVVTISLKHYVWS